MNKSAVDRGLFSSTFYRTYKEQNNKNHSNGEEEVFTKPDPRTTKGIKPFNYDKLNEDGFVPENTYVDSGDIIIGKCMPQKIDNSIVYKDTSISLKNNETGFIDRNCYGDKYFTNINGEGYTFAKVRIRNMRVPTIGDKFCLPPSADVLCEDGWKPIAEVTTTDKVAQLNEDGTFEYVCPIATYEFEHDGEMYSVQSPHIDLSVTPEHKMYVRFAGKDKYKLVQAKDAFGRGSYYKKDARNKSQEDRERAYRHITELIGDKNSYKTRDKEEADRLQQMALHAGISATIVDMEDELHVCFTKRDITPHVTSKNEYITRYVGKVYCVEVPSHVFYVRMNGKGVWTGNSSRHGQKGTVGMLYRQEDMPYNKDGIVPDIIVNPHAIPSRMTIAQLMECLLGKACASVGSYGDATPFTNLTVEDIADIVQSKGMERYGNEILYNPRTGEQMDTIVFMGPTFYQRLKHMTCDKIHSRSNAGPLILLTRQPAEGRAREGGLRLGLFIWLRITDILLVL